MAIVALIVIYIAGVIGTVSYGARKYAVKQGASRVELRHIDIAFEGGLVLWWPVILAFVAIAGPLYLSGVGFAKAWEYLLNVKPLPAAIELKMKEERKKLQESRNRLTKLEQELEVSQAELNALAAESVQSPEAL